MFGAYTCSDQEAFGCAAPGALGYSPSLGTVAAGPRARRDRPAPSTSLKVPPSCGTCKLRRQQRRPMLGREMQLREITVIGILALCMLWTVILGVFLIRTAR